MSEGARECQSREGMSEGDRECQSKEGMSEGPGHANPGRG